MFLFSCDILSEKIGFEEKLSPTRIRQSLCLSLQKYRDWHEFNLVFDVTCTIAWDNGLVLNVKLTRNELILAGGMYKSFLIGINKIQVMTAKTNSERAHVTENGNT